MATLVGTHYVTPVMMALGHTNGTGQNLATTESEKPLEKAWRDRGSGEPQAEVIGKGEGGALSGCNCGWPHVMGSAWTNSQDAHMTTGLRKTLT